MCVKRLCTSKPTSSDKQAVQTAEVIVDCVLCLCCHVPLLRDGATGFNDVPVLRDGATGFNCVPLLRDHATDFNYVPLLGDHATDFNG